MTYEAVLGAEPEGVVRPESLEDAMALVQAAAESETALIPWGGGSAQDYGRPPRAPFVLFETAGLSRVLAVEPGDLIITVEAGVTMARVQAALAPHGQFLPLDPPAPDAATVGGVIATGACGPLRLGYGTPRDWLIGLRVIDARGRLIRGGGKVVKNVTGYDLPKMHIGALGTLGLIVEATFKTCPLPEAVRTVAIPLGGEEVSSLAAALLEKTSPVQALLHEDESGRFLALVYHGPTEAALEASGFAVRLAEEVGLGASVYAEEFPAATPPAPVAVRLGGLPSEGVALHKAARAAAGSSAVLDTQLGVGESLVCWSADTDDSRSGVHSLFSLAEARGLRATLLHGPLELRRNLPAVWYPAPAALPLMRALKESLDPGGLLNPGRFVGGI